MLFGSLPALSSPVGWRLATSAVLYIAGVWLLWTGWPRSSRSFLSVEADGVMWRTPGEPPLRLQLLRLERSPWPIFRKYARFTIFGVNGGTRVRLRSANNPALLWDFARELDVSLPVECGWGSGNLLPLKSVSKTTKVAGSPWPNQERVGRTLALLGVVLLVAWLVILGRSTSAVRGVSVSLAFASWLFLMLVAALCALDRVEVKMGDVLNVKRSRLGVLTFQFSAGWDELTRLELLEDVVGNGFLLIVCEKGHTESVAVPLSGRAQQEFMAWATGAVAPTR